MMGYQKLLNITRMPKSNPKICFVVAVDLTLKFLLFSQIEFFKNNGYDVSLVCSPGKWLDDIKQQGVKVKEITIKRKVFTPISDVVSLFQLFFYFKKEKFDIVFAFTPKPGLLGQLAAKAAGVPIIINTIFGYYFHEGTSWLKKKFYITIERVAGSFSNKVFFRNKEDFQTAKQEKIIKFDKAEYVGDGIDIEKFNPVRFSETLIQEKKHALGIFVGVSVVGIVARLVGEKGYQELFDAFRIVLEKFPSTMLLVIGSADIQKKDSINPHVIKSMGMEKNVVFLGERIDVDELYSVMNIFVLPSYREGFPHSIMEASAMARPVITTNVRGCREAVSNNITGVIVPPKDSQALANALIYLLSNPEVAKKMGEAGRKKAQQDFDERVLFNKMEKASRMLLMQKHI